METLDLINVFVNIIRCAIEVYRFVKQERLV